MQWLLAAIALMIGLGEGAIDQPSIITNDNYTYIVRDSNQSTCMYASFEMNFYLYQTSTNQSDGVPPCSTVTVPSIHDSSFKTFNGTCDYSNGSYALNIYWSGSGNSNFDVSLSFSKNNSLSTWTLRQVVFTFNERYLDMSYSNGTRTYQTQDTDLFNRTFSDDQYFYCERCKMINFTDLDDACVNVSSGETWCSYVTIDRAVIYLGNITGSNAQRQLCIEDWIALNELIIPIVVGGLLALLLVVVIMVYIIAFIKRRIVEKRTVKYKKLEQ